jgi:NAD(P)-dependent dehydrogenase (short-subunit alcohol dehydrogenase family)
LTGFFCQLLSYVQIISKRRVEMANLFRGKVALVTGASSGIGRVSAQFFAREGAKVVIAADKNIKGGEETAALIKAGGGEAFFVKCDVSKTSEVKDMVDQCVQTYGRLDYAFNNAGVGGDGKRMLIYDLINLPEEDWDRVVDVNLKGAWLCLKYEVMQMVRQKSGSIVFTGSVGALKGAPGLGAYSASKHGLVGLTKTAAKEFAQYGIRVNMICPGPTENTLLFDNYTSSTPGLREESLKTIPLGRMGTPEDMAEAVIWLCSDASSYITGQALPIEGGMIA